MRSIVPFIVAAVVSSPLVARAQPADCAAVGTAPASATIPQPALSAKISLALCQAESSFGALQLKPDGTSIGEMTNAAAPSLTLLDQVIQSGDTTFAPIATKAKAGLMIAMAVRMRNSISPVSATTVGPALAAHDQAHAALEPKIAAWLGGN
ncbi:MAG TPA: hypothetical protein VGG28_05035 [Kofleriaceae bacterium]|jgi:hypothetical protein